MARNWLQYFLEQSAMLGIVQYKNPSNVIHGNEKLSCVDPSAGFYGSPAGGFLKR